MTSISDTPTTDITIAGDNGLELLRQIEGFLRVVDAQTKTRPGSFALQSREPLVKVQSGMRCCIVGGVDSNGRACFKISLEGLAFFFDITGSPARLGKSTSTATQRLNTLLHQFLVILVPDFDSLKNADVVLQHIHNAQLSFAGAGNISAFAPFVPFAPRLEQLAATAATVAPTTVATTTATVTTAVAPGAAAPTAVATVAKPATTTPATVATIAPIPTVAVVATVATVATAPPTVVATVVKQGGSSSGGAASLQQVAAAAHIKQRQVDGEIFGNLNSAYRLTGIVDEARMVMYGGSQVVVRFCQVEGTPNNPWRIFYEDEFEKIFPANMLAFLPKIPTPPQLVATQAKGEIYDASHMLVLPKGASSVAAASSVKIKLAANTQQQSANSQGNTYNNNKRKAPPTTARKAKVLDDQEDDDNHSTTEDAQEQVTVTGDKRAKT